MIDLMLGDCVDVMSNIKSESVDMILCDLPYGTTACKWDTVIPFESLWEQYNRIAKPNAAIVLTASQPFTSLLVNSNLAQFKYSLVWEKERPSNPAVANKRFMKWHEDILVFSDKTHTYNPQMTKRPIGNKRNNKLGIHHTSEVYGNLKLQQGDGMKDEKHPSSVIKVNVQRGLHPTQKPADLMEYLIRTYTNPGEVVLDNCMGSGTTGVACVKSNRRFIGIEKDKQYFELARLRISVTPSALNE